MRPDAVANRPAVVTWGVAGEGFLGAPGYLGRGRFERGYLLRGTWEVSLRGDGETPGATATLDEG
jgi:hypothetical protein